MIDFIYSAPTHVLFSKDMELQTGNEVARCGAHSVLVHFGGGSAERSGLVARVVESLTSAGISSVVMGGAKPNPVLSTVREGIELCRTTGVDFILAIGGGSAIDSAKAIAYGVANPSHDVWDLYSGKQKATACLPIGCVLTIAAAGSETSNSSVITNEATGQKRAYDDDIARPRFAIMNPELTCSVPYYHTMSGAVDIMMHTMERYFSNVTEVRLVDAFSESLLRTVVDTAYRLKDNLQDYDARAEMMWAGSLSHNGLTGTGKIGDFACHLLEHELSGMFDVAHGAGLAALWPSWARHVYKRNIPRFAQYATTVMRCTMNFDDPEETALAGIAATERFFRDIDMPTSIGDLGIADLTEEAIEEMADKCSLFGKQTIGNFVELDKEAMKSIYRSAR